MKLVTHHDPEPHGNEDLSQVPGQPNNVVIPEDDFDDDADDEMGTNSSDIDEVFRRFDFGLDSDDSLLEDLERAVLSDPERQNLRSLIENNRAERQKKLSQILSKDEADILLQLGDAFKSDRIFDFYKFSDVMNVAESEVPSTTMSPGILHAVEFVKNIPGLEELCDHDIMTLMHHHLLDVIGLRMAEIFDKNEDCIMFSNKSFSASDLELYPWMTRIYKYVKRYATFATQDGVVLGCLAAIRFLSTDNVKVEDEALIDETLEKIQQTFLKYLQQEKICKVHSIYMGLSNFEDIRAKDAPVLSRLSMLDSFVGPDPSASPAPPCGGPQSTQSHFEPPPPHNFQNGASAITDGATSRSSIVNPKLRGAEFLTSAVAGLSHSIKHGGPDAEIIPDSDIPVSNTPVSNKAASSEAQARPSFTVTSRQPFKAANHPWYNLPKSPISCPIPPPSANPPPPIDWSKQLDHEAWFPRNPGSGHNIAAGHAHVQNGAQSTPAGQESNNAIGSLDKHQASNQEMKIKREPVGNGHRIDNSHDMHRSQPPAPDVAMETEMHRQNGAEMMMMMATSRNVDNRPSPAVSERHLTNGYHYHPDDKKIGQPQLAMIPNGFHQNGSQGPARQVVEDRHSRAEEKRVNKGPHFSNGDSRLNKCGYESHHGPAYPDECEMEQGETPLAQASNRMLETRRQDNHPQQREKPREIPSIPPLAQTKSSGSKIGAYSNGTSATATRQDLNKMPFQTEAAAAAGIEINPRNDHHHPGLLFAANQESAGARPIDRCVNRSIIQDDRAKFEPTDDQVMIMNQLLIRNTYLEQKVQELSRQRVDSSQLELLQQQQQQQRRDIEALVMSQRGNGIDLMAPISSFASGASSQPLRVRPADMAVLGQSALSLMNGGKLDFNGPAPGRAHSSSSQLMCERDRQMINQPSGRNMFPPQSPSNHAYPPATPPSHSQNQQYLVQAHAPNSSIISALQRPPQCLSDDRRDLPRHVNGLPHSSTGNDFQQRPLDATRNAAGPATKGLSSFVRNIPPSFNLHDERAQDLSLGSHRRDKETNQHQSAMPDPPPTHQQQQHGRSASFSGHLPESQHQRRNSGPSSTPSHHHQQQACSPFKDSPPISSMSSDEGNSMYANMTPPETRRASFSSSTSSPSSSTHRGLKKRWLSRHTGDNSDGGKS